MQFRCKNCNKLLAVGSGDFEIKCPRCKETNSCRSLTTGNAVEHRDPKGNHECPTIRTPNR
ncbi:Com family DNA-binding transcriptional regulator [Neisseria animalis]|uniref:Com family DNA-binding transcriptional regulator n=1 Tax=Neisseria animalis TaxID=492 RepID=A0A5P3MPS6_NEIAN|nr:Com family DNA-binding transcriptional regulator [Neisseria animalis]QEY23562.1 Com family DNA-binding transcriptional regulator [Neisseria animalis]ROW32162.1 Com family DNA-binding transcriptional regulator [Neisseria animalis]VEE09223.1 Mu-like prophage protein Com [Neisseria animalis]